ncbi:MAG TPA: nuclear transport factor 2 family protein [Edaphobacter sp.]|jgi:hypothetical protein
MKFSIALCTSFVLAVSFAVGQAADTSSVEQQLKSRIHQMDAGLTKADVPAYLAVAVPELVTLHDDDVFSTRESFEQHLSKDLKVFKISSFDSRINNLKVVGDLAMTDITSTFVGDMADKKNPVVMHHYVLDLKFKDEWRRIDGDWKMTRFEQLGSTGTMDGKPLPTHS